MKRVIILLFLYVLGLYAFAQDSFFEKYEGTKNVSVAFISNNMLKAMDNKKGTNMSKDIFNLRIMEVKDSKLVPKIKDDALNTFIPQKGFIDVARISEDGETTIIRHKKIIPKIQKKNTPPVETFVLISYTETTLDILSVSGNDLDLSDIQKIRK